jgi:soluble cytochrome b562
MKLDAGRLSQLRVFSKSELRQIGLDSMRAIAAALDDLDRALAAGELENARDAAHRARNETLIVGAEDLGDALAAVEQATQAGRLERAREAAASARTLWPETRAALAQLVGGLDGQPGE